MENKSPEIVHHLGIQKDAKFCLKYTKIRLAKVLMLIEARKSVPA